MRDRASKAHIDTDMTMLQALAEPEHGTLVAIGLGKWIEGSDAPSQRMTPQVKTRSFMNSLSWNLHRYRTEGQYNEDMMRQKKPTLGWHTRSRNPVA